MTECSNYCLCKKNENIRKYCQKIILLISLLNVLNDAKKEDIL